MLVVEHWPTLALAGAILTVAYLGIRTLALTVDSIGNALGPLGEFWRKRRAISRAEIDDLQRQVEYLKRQVDDLRGREECHWEFVLKDQEYHRRLELAAVGGGYVIPPHQSYMEHREEWLRRHKEYAPFF